MKTQNYSNHRKFVPGYHFITFSIIFILFLLSSYNIFRAVSEKSGILDALMFFMISVSLVSIFFYARIFSLKAQDRAIRAEENLRHFIQTGKVFDTRLSISQILALRFASDNEFIELAKKALNENLNSDEIKKSIKEWKADYYRV